MRRVFRRIVFLFFAGVPVMMWGMAAQAQEGGAPTATAVSRNDLPDKPEPLRSADTLSSNVAEADPGSVATPGSAYGAPAVVDETTCPGGEGKNAASGANGTADHAEQSGSDQKQGQESSQKNRLAVNPVTGFVTSAGQFCPLTGRERLKLYLSSNYTSIGAYFGPVLSAGLIYQPEDSPPQWGRGASGFGLRVASNLGSGIVGGTIHAPLAALMHEDVRYIASNDRNTKRRLLHAVVYTFITYNNGGHPTLNYSNYIATYASTAISTQWQPKKYDVAKYALSNGSKQVVLNVPTNILQEFWPDIDHKIFHRKQE